MSYSNVVEYTGYVRAFTQREKQNLHNPQIKDYIWSFRLERFDQYRQPLDPPIPVEIVGAYLNGSLRDGDEVTIRGTINKYNTLEASSLNNISTSGIVSSKSYDKIRTTVIVIAVILFAIFAIILFGKGQGQPQTETKEMQQMNSEIEAQKQQINQDMEQEKKRMKKDQAEFDKEWKKRNR